MIVCLDDTGKIFTLMNTCHTSPGRQAAIVDSLLHFTAEFARSLPGFIGAAMHISLDGGWVANYVQRRSRADIQAMLTLPEAQAHMAEV